MYKKVLLSLGIIAVVSAVAISGTGAFFSDSETSTGNTFTAGSIDLKVDSTAHYAGLICVATGEDQSGNPTYTWELEDPQVPTTRPDLLDQPCSGTWALKDLNPQLDKFFNLSDIKPGDDGENTVSIHIDNNPAYACVDITNIQNNDNTHIQPEINAGDATAGPIGEGELGQNLNFLVWLDQGATPGFSGDDVGEGDNIWGVGEPLLTQGTAPSTNQTYTLADSDTAPLPGGTTGYLGVAWCAGTWTNVGPGTSTCDGSTMGNEAQTDSYSADLTFRVEQARNNGEFQCTPPEEGGDVVVAASYATGFEPGEGFAPGNINGQSGWKKTGSYDAEVESSPVIADLQSLRISNAVTSGAFGDQTFAPDLASGAGETGIGDSENHFEAQFDIASVLGALQAGLVISVSPDDGNGARMSYLRFEDQADGIHVHFVDVVDAGPIGTVASFPDQDIATITRTPHTIKFVMDFVDGPANDVVKIYIDNVLEVTGTSWEDYYRYDPEQAGNGNLLSEVDTLIFRAGGTAAPANSGNGFLFDKVSLLSGNI